MPSKRLGLIMALVLALVLLSTGMVLAAQTQSLYWQRFDVDITVLPNSDFQVS
jgi:hypothetical protein